MAEQINSLAQEIRRVDGTHSLGAGALAEALMPWLAAHDRQVAERAWDECAERVQAAHIRGALTRQNPYRADSLATNGADDE